jgi:uncharacterized protein YvpB
MLLSLLAAVQLVSGTSQVIALRPNAPFPPAGAPLTITYSDIAPGRPFSEVIPSWNVRNPANAQLRIELRARINGQPTQWYRLADWSLNPYGKRASMDGQSDPYATVITDTLSLKSPGESVDVRLTLESIGIASGHLELITLAFSDRKPKSNGAVEVTPPVRSSAWGKSIEVPEKAQGDYPRGSVLCSPTSISMLLTHYGEQLDQVELNLDVPLVEASVWDPVYNGAGNWSFNTAFVGSLPGMRSYVARWSDISDLEKWIVAGLPVVCSVSFDMLQGKPLSPTESGHLVVLVGFTESGDPIFNDPAKRGKVRTAYKRSDFERAWLYSNRTVYVVHPIGTKVPSPSNRLWITN